MASRKKHRDRAKHATAEWSEPGHTTKNGQVPNSDKEVIPISGGVKSRSFVFQSGKDCLDIKILELLDPSYGMYVWPCAPVLAQYIWYHREYIKGKRVLEVGAGTGLPGILAALLGARVTLSESVMAPQAMKHTQRNVEANGLTPNEVPVVGISWGVFSPPMFSLGPLDYILGSDVLYEPKDFENVLVTIAYLLHQNPHARFWCTYQIRNAEYSLEALLKRWNLICYQVPLDTFEGESGNIAGSGLPGSHQIQMLVMAVDSGTGSSVADVPESTASVSGKIGNPVNSSGSIVGGATGVVNPSPMKDVGGKIG